MFDSHNGLSRKTYFVACLLIIIAAAVTYYYANLNYPHGKRCSKTSQCESSSLFCINGTCQCFDENRMEFHFADERHTVPVCTVHAGESCIVNKANEDKGQKNPNLKELDCTPNAVCKNGICECENSFKFRIHCLPYEHFRHGIPCSDEGKCDPNNDLLSCVNKVCTCNEKEAEYDRNLKTCIGKVGASCKKYRGKCVENAHCDGNDGDKGMCQCEKGAVKDSDGYCDDAWGYPCNLDMPPCPGDLICINKYCSCPVEHYQEFDISKAKCISMFHGPCSKTVIAGMTYNFSCKDPLECRNERGVMECLCSKGVIATKEGRCKPTFGSPCSGFCGDSSSGLQCINGKCGCEGLQEYDVDKQICRGLVGSACDLRKSGKTCVDGASCEGNRGKSWMGLCQCKRGYQASAERGCIHT